MKKWTNISENCRYGAADKFHSKTWCQPCSEKWSLEKRVAPVLAEGLGGKGPRCEEGSCSPPERKESENCERAGRYFCLCWLGRRWGRGAAQYWRVSEGGLAYIGTCAHCRYIFYLKQYQPPPPLKGKGLQSSLWSVFVCSFSRACKIYSHRTGTRQDRGSLLLVLYLFSLLW